MVHASKADAMAGQREKEEVSTALGECAGSDSSALFSQPYTALFIPQHRYTR